MRPQITFLWRFNKPFFDTARIILIIHWNYVLIWIILIVFTSGRPSGTLLFMHILDDKASVVTLCFLASVKYLSELVNEGLTSDRRWIKVHLSFFFIFLDELIRDKCFAEIQLGNEISWLGLRFQSFEIGIWNIRALLGAIIGWHWTLHDAWICSLRLLNWNVNLKLGSTLLNYIRFQGSIHLIDASYLLWMLGCMRGFPSIRKYLRRKRS